MQMDRDARAKMRAAAERLHHLSMVYAGDINALVHGNDAASMVPKGHPGLKGVRDLADLVLLTRAEINALIALLVGKAFTGDEFTRQVTEEYDHLAKVKGEQFGVECTDVGLRITPLRDKN